VSLCGVHAYGVVPVLCQHLPRVGALGSALHGYQTSNHLAALRPRRSRRLIIDHDGRGVPVKRSTRQSRSGQIFRPSLPAGTDTRQALSSRWCDTIP
jgi:hypothetical protein